MCDWQRPVQPPAEQLALIWSLPTGRDDTEAWLSYDGEWI